MGLDNEELKGRCETCGGLPKGNHGRLALDHDHSVIGAKHGSVEERLWPHERRQRCGPRVHLVARVRVLRGRRAIGCRRRLHGVRPAEQEERPEVQGTGSSS